VLERDGRKQQRASAERGTAHVHKSFQYFSVFMSIFTSLCDFCTWRLGIFLRRKCRCTVCLILVLENFIIVGFVKPAVI